MQKSYAIHRFVGPAALKSPTRLHEDPLFVQWPIGRRYLRLQAPGNRIEQSLRTSDRREAEILALPEIAKHKAALLAARPRFETIWQHQYEPGREHVGPDGGRILATDCELFFIGHNGSITRTEPNGGPAHRLVGGPLTLRSLAEAVIDADLGEGREIGRAHV